MKNNFIDALITLYSFPMNLSYSSYSLSIYFDYPFKALKKIIVDVSTIFIRLRPDYFIYC